MVFVVTCGDWYLHCGVVVTGTYTVVFVVTGTYSVVFCGDRYLQCGVLW